VNQQSLKNYNQFLQPDKIRLNKRVYMFLFFLVISIILWLLIKLRYEYVSTITYKVNLSELPETKVALTSDSLTVTLRVKALGYNLLRYKLFKYYKPLSISAQGADFVKGNYYVVLSGQLDNFTSQLGADFTLLEVSPDTLYFHLNDVVQKRVPVKPDLNITYSKQHMQAGSYIVVPKVVKVTGPAAIIDTLSCVYSQPLTLEDVYNNISTTIPIKPMKGLSFKPSEVSISIPVEKFTEARVNVPISCINIPYGYEVMLSPKTVSVACNVAVSKYFALKPDHFSIICDYNDLVMETSGKALVKLVKYPDFIGNIQIDPRKVDFIIIKKKQ